MHIFKGSVYDRNSNFQFRNWSKESKLHIPFRITSGVEYMQQKRSYIRDPSVQLEFGVNAIIDFSRSVYHEVHSFLFSLENLHTQKIGTIFFI